ncbi:MAG: transposase zinc-binding domain-containing protein [Rubrivivax sp.]|jgi:hypothetical protein|nr:transposase zinc-binding domain-containing protein [Rubrivivax sp.]MBK7263352.1 transposase zinc-binding domain-containing protein [Rubrivivax sp.]MBK8528835.1 transposase zinc-binding domain-containing protein [Rubrivivax sp.]
MARRSTTSDTDTNKPRCTAWCRRTPQPSSSRLSPQPAANLPQFGKDEFDVILECGILAYGFPRLRCGDCGHDKLLDFSSKRRGFCPSCGARHIAQTAAYLVDHAPVGTGAADSTRCCTRSSAG